MPAEGEMRAPQRSSDDLPAITADVLERIREKRPRVHCITNAVAQNFTANMLLAAGAVPSMTIAQKEVRAFAARADALLVNLGTFDAERQKAVACGDRRRQQARHALGARSGVHRPLAAARGVCQNAAGQEAARDPAQRRRVRRAVGRQDRRRSAGAGSPRRGGRWSASPASTISCATARGSPPSPTAIR